jgi:phosphoribosylformimino-5-aminoimidazole carboxamide ribotide isomerase
MKNQMEYILPVLDLMHGLVVRGVAGRRDEYLPLVSPLAGSAEPLAIARAFRTHFGFEEIYVADLDAILGHQPAGELYESLQADGFRLWIDAGLNDADDAKLDAVSDVHRVIVGLETVAGPDALQRLLARVGPDRLVFSLDLKGGQPLARAEWGGTDPWAIAERGRTIGMKRLLILDLADVGMGQGVRTEAFCTRLRQTDPQIEIIAGGGVRGIGDVQRLVSLGVDRVLVASALHDGRILPLPA